MEGQHGSATELPHDFEEGIDALYHAAHGIKELGEGHRRLHWMNGAYLAMPAAAPAPAQHSDGVVLRDAIEMVLREKTSEGQERSLCVEDIVEYHIIGRAGVAERIRILFNGEPTDAAVTMTAAMVYESAKECIALCAKVKQGA